MWLWGLKDFLILCILLLISAFALVKLGWLIPMAITLCYGFLTIRKDDATVMNFIMFSVKYFLTEQQMYKWR
ncbi:MAG: hypothetical protein IJB34_08285 [Clostridia bacterium]|nr:hypothetical protein [Clostridia bacterium]